MQSLETLKTMWTSSHLSYRLLEKSLSGLFWVRRTFITVLKNTQWLLSRISPKRPSIFELDTSARSDQADWCVGVAVSETHSAFMTAIVFFFKLGCHLHWRICRIELLWNFIQIYLILLNFLQNQNIYPKKLSIVTNGFFQRARLDLFLNLNN